MPIPSNVDWSQFKTTPVVAPPKTQGQATSFADVNWNQFKTNKTPVAPPKPPVQPLGNRFMKALGSTASSFSKNGAGGVVGAVKGITQPLVNAGAAIESGLDETLGRAGNIVAGRGNVPTQTGAKSFAETMTAPVGTAQKAGAVVGDVAPYLTPEAPEAAASDAPAALSFAQKLGSAVVKRAPEFAKNAGVGTAQTKNPVQGVENAALFEAGDKALDIAGKGLKAVLPSAEKTSAKILDMLTPRITGKAYQKVGASGGKLSEPGFLEKAGVDGSAMKSVQHAYQSVQNVASILGKKSSDIIKTGTAQVTKNINRVNDAVSQYAEKHVAPFLEKAGVNYNFGDLRKALEIVKPVNDLKGEAQTAYNTTRERILAAVAKKVSTQTTGGKSLAELRALGDTSGTVPQKVSGGDKDFWDARKIIDEIGTAETKGKIFGSEAHSGASAAWKDLRAGFKGYLSDGFRYPGQMEKVNQANDFLSTAQTTKMDKTGWNIGDVEKQFGLTPSPQSVSGANQWEQHMSNLEGLFNARTGMSTKLNAEAGKNFMEVLAKEHPQTMKLLTGIAKVVGTGLVTSAGLGGLYEGAKQVGL